MAESGGLSGVAVGMAAVGGLLVYAGFQGITPLEALKDLRAGKSRRLEPVPVSWTRDPTTRRSGGGDLVQVGTGGTAGSPTGAALVRALQAHADEKYSQSRRWQAGYSDCSSWIGKGLKDIGVTPPGASVTGSYLTWRKLTTVSRSDIRAGDLLCGGGHIAIALSPTTAQGQQNSRHNVRSGPIDQIMFGQGAWVPRRFAAAAAPGTAAA